VDKTWSIFPNPANQQVTVRPGSSVNGDFSIEIRNLQGMLILSQNSHGNREMVIQTGRLPQGLYLMRISCGNELTARKLIITR
jgi:hypothetical protein